MLWICAHPLFLLFVCMCVFILLWRKFYLEFASCIWVFFFFLTLLSIVAFQMAIVVKNLPANAGNARDTSLIPGLGRSLGEGNGNPLKYPCLENSMDRRTWWATVHRVVKSLTCLKQLSMHIVDLQCCVSFKCTAKWFSYTYTYSHSFSVFSHIGLSQNTKYSSLYCTAGPIVK